MVHIVVSICPGVAYTIGAQLVFAQINMAHTWAPKLIVAQMTLAHMNMTHINVSKVCLY